MKITLISPYYDLASVGVRLLSSCLKAAGHHTRMVFLPQARGGYLNDFQIYENDRVVEALVEICADSDLIGITLMTNYFFRVARLTEKLKKHLQQPVIWGGVHATIRPEECLQYADMVCLDEGEAALTELCDGLQNDRFPTDVRGIWLKHGGSVVQNEVRPLIQDLDSLPYPDYSLDDSHILVNGEIRPASLTLLRQALVRGMTIEKSKVAYQIITSRGCPLNCSYCCNDVFRSLHPHEKYLRHRSAENIIGELVQAAHRLDFVEGVWISDDSFISQSLAYLEEFAAHYKKRVGLPFFCLGDPIHLSEQKLEVLIDAGLKLMTMGIQTGSSRTRKLYRRDISNERVLEATDLLHKFRGQMQPPMYDIIVDNPYESLQDQFETIQLVAKIPQPHYLQLFSLTLFPGSSLHKRAIQDRIIEDGYSEIYNKPYYRRAPSYHNVLLRLYNRQVPRFILEILSSRTCYFFFSATIFQRLYKLLDRLWGVIRKRQSGA